VEYQDIHSLFKAFEKFNILIIGDVMIDAYLWGRVDRISPEAPVPVVSCTQRENRLGGAANVALNIKSLGGNPILCSVVGNDEKGILFRDLMGQSNMTSMGIMTDELRPTTVKTRIIGGSQHLLRVDQEITSELSRLMEETFIAQIEKITESEKINAIIFQDYDKGCISKTVIEKIVHLSKIKKIPTLVDPKRKHFFDYKNVTLFKPNFKEFKEGLNEMLVKGDFDTLHDLADRFMKDQRLEYLMVTLSELGIYITDGDSHQHIPAEIRDISDVSGAGDTVIAVAGLAMAAGLNPRELARLSNFAGGLVCERVGVVPIQKQWIVEDGFEF
jgi:D-glycero-beta-D-manno-heptose-7-phosphate kinase